MRIGPCASLTAPTALATRLALALSLTAAPAPAQPNPPPGPPAVVSPASLPAPAVEPASRHRVPWRYPKFRAWEWAASLTVSVASLGVQFGTDRIPDNNWVRGLPLDGELRNTLVATSQAGRERAARISDLSWPIVQYFPVVDSLFTPLVTDHGNVETAFQLTLLNWEAQSLAFLITRGTHRVVGRSRPLVQECEDSPTYDLLCNPRAGGRRASMLSGHTSMAFAGAGLTCAHHLAMPLYGARWADLGVCLVTLAGATTTGVLRIVADRHWTSDVLLGAGVGLATGWLMPWALHYARWNVRTAHGSAIEGTVVPAAVGATGVGLSTMGMF